MVMVPSTESKRPSLPALIPCRSESGVEKIKVIKYKEPGHIYSKQISEEGDSLLIGLEPKESHGKPETNLLCKRDNCKDELVGEEYNLKIFTRARNYRKFDEGKENADLANYFFLIRKEVWSCQEGADTTKGIMMIVNELVGIKNIYEVKYYDGIEVSTAYLPGGVRTARVKETRFFKVCDPLNPLRYEGTVSYHDLGQFFYNIPGYVKTNKETVVGKVSVDNYDMINEVQFELSDSSTTHSTEISGKDSGKILKIGSPWTKVFEKNMDQDNNNKLVSVCFPEQGLNPFPYEFRTTVYDLLKPNIPSAEVAGRLSEEQQNQKVSALLTEKFFMKYFIPIKEEVWTCTSMEGKNFLRIVNEVVGLIEVKELKFVDGITHIHTVTNAGLAKTVRFREVKYLDPVTKEVLKYEGALRLDEKSLKTSTENKIAFNLDANRLYRTLINSEGYDLRVGSRWDREIGTTEDTVQCTFRDGGFLKEYRTKFRIKTEIKNGVIATHRLEYVTKNRKHEYFDFVDGEFLLCDGTNSNGDKVRFLRIMNEMEMNVPVHQIEFYDGVEVFEKVTDTDSSKKSVGIREIKYLSADGKFDVLKYEGSITLGAHTRNEWKDWQAVEVQKDNIFWVIGHLTGRKYELKERTYTLPKDSYHSIVTGYHENELYVGEYAENELGTATDTVVCEKTVQSASSSFTKAKIKTQASSSCSPIGNLAMYFKSTDAEVWDCKNVAENNNINFYRVTTRFHLMKHDPFLFGKVNFADSEKVWAEVSDEEDGFQVEIEEIVYSKILMTRRLFIGQGPTLEKYEGYLILDDGNDSNGVKKSGTTEFTDDKEKFNRICDYLAEDIKYLTDRDTEYHETIVNNEGESLLIGSKWEKKFGDGDMIMQCELSPFQEGLFDTYFRTRVKKAGTNINNQLLFQTYFDDLKTEIWKCKVKGDSTSRGFLRILTQFSIKPKHCKKVAKIWHYDGVTVLTGDYVYGDEGCMEIAEVKYLDPELFIPLKFEGKVQLFNGKYPVAKKITSVRLSDVARIEVHNQPELHMKNKILKTVVKDEGLTIEVGSPYEDVLRIKKAVCSELSGFDTEDKEIYRPTIVINSKTTSDTSTKPVKMTEDEFKLCFETPIREVWKCQEQPGDGLTFYRVVNKILPKESDCQIARVYYRPGVTVDVKPSLSITEIKYIKLFNMKISRYEGFLNIIERSLKTSDADTFGGESKEIVYGLDTASLFSTKFQENGVILEVGSQWDGEFGTADDSVLCGRKMEHKIDKSYNTKVFSNVEGMSDTNARVEMDSRTFSTYFDVVRQEVWICKKTEDKTFLRVVNFNLALKDISQIYHPDGITIGTQVYPDGTKSTRIIEIKYLDSVTKRPLRYNGEMTLEISISDRHTKLFQMPNEFQSFTTETRSADKVKFWPVDVLRVHALKVKKKAKADELSAAEKVKYTPKNIHVTMIAEGYDVKMKVGSQWEKEFKTRSNQMTCMQDQWNPTNKRQFLTKVQLYYDNEKYELNYDTINDHFIIKKIEVWICVNQDDTMLRVVTTLEGTTGIFVVLHRDGVTVEPLTLKDGGSSAKIIETKFMDPKYFKILKYDGDLQLIKPLPGIKRPEIAPPEWRSNDEVRKKHWTDQLLGWSSQLRSTTVAMARSAATTVATAAAARGVQIT